MRQPQLMQRILGIDPGLQRTGFGVIDAQGAALRYVGSGVIRTAAHTSLAERIGTIVRGVREVAAEMQADCAVVEIVFVNVNPQSTLLLGQARGAAIAGLVLADLPVHEYTALQIKKSVVGSGRASKEQIQQMVMRLLRLPNAPQADAADALACAIMHAHAGGHMAQLLSASGSDAVSGSNAIRRAVRRGRLV